MALQMHVTSKHVKGEPAYVTSGKQFNRFVKKQKHRRAVRLNQAQVYVSVCA